LAGEKFFREEFSLLLLRRKMNKDEVNVDRRSTTMEAEKAILEAYARGLLSRGVAMQQAWPGLVRRPSSANEHPWHRAPLSLTRGNARHETIC
jgi:hypothetical protein